MSAQASETTLPDIGLDPDVLAAVRSLSKLCEDKMAACGAELGTMAVVWIAVEPEGNSASCLLMNDPGPDALEHMADCILGIDDEFQTVACASPPSMN